MNGTDHDLLIRVDTKVQTLIDEMKQMRDVTNNRLLAVEQGKVDNNDFHEFKSEINQRINTMDLEIKKTLLERDKSNSLAFKAVSDQIDNLKKIVYVGIGIVLCLQFVIMFLK